MKELVEKLVSQDKIEFSDKELPVKYQFIIATLLVYAAKADDYMSDDERMLIFNSLAKEFSISHTEVSEMIETAVYLHNKGKSLDDLLKKINKVLSVSQKSHLLSVITKVINSDTIVRGSEKGFINRITEVLEIDPAEYENV